MTIATEAMAQARTEIAEEDFRAEVERAKVEIRKFEGSLLGKIKKAFTTHKIVIRLERRKI